MGAGFLMVNQKVCMLFCWVLSLRAWIDKNGVLSAFCGFPCLLIVAGFVSYNAILARFRGMYTFAWLFAQ